MAGLRINVALCFLMLFCVGNIYAMRREMSPCLKPNPNGGGGFVNRTCAGFIGELCPEGCKCVGLNPTIADDQGYCIPETSKVDSKAIN